ncbi:MAG TPA: hypothetical protein VM370_08625 [Candidatus Thermoplasmatota archaeon]|nr:hypothetical protein [Candidatus Thermoplasmatota archaeon]
MGESVAEPLAFRFQHGPLARSLAEFGAIVAQAPVDVVWYHRAHIVPWLRDVLREVALARRLDALAESGPAPDVYREIVVELVRRRIAGQVTTD